MVKLVRGVLIIPCRESLMKSQIPRLWSGVGSERKDWAIILDFNVILSNNGFYNYVIINNP